MNAKERADWDKLFTYLYQGREDAKAISFEILDLVHIWDDLYDQDKDVSPEQVNQAFFSAIYGLQTNPVWQQCALGAHMLNVVLRWKDANVLEREKKSDDDLNKAYMLRAGVHDLFLIIAFHFFGMEWAEKVGPVLRRFYAETLDEYLEEMR